MDTSSTNRRIAKNTIMLYIRMLLLMVVNLYTSRIVLQALGVVDFGIYNAVGGFIAMFSVISGAITTAISRFFTFELGKGLDEYGEDGINANLRKIFSTSIIIQASIGVFILLLCETIGVWFLNTRMVIPTERMLAANWVLQFSAVTFFINLISVPYNAAIIAYERMNIFAYIGIFQALATLVIAFVVRDTSFDNLIVYSGLLCLLSVVMRVLYGIYCGRNFKTTKFKWAVDFTLIKQIFSFAGWNFIGASSGILRTQGVNVLMNIFCGPVINAARGLSVQVHSAVSMFINNFMTALNPQIMKNYASGNRDYLFFLVFQGARFSQYLTLALSFPILFETATILNIWLTETPDYTVAFIRLVFVYGMIEGLSGTMTTLMLATGRIRNYQLVVGGLQLLHFPAAYVVLKLGYEPQWTYVCAMVVGICCLIARLEMLNKMVGLPIGLFVKKVIFNNLIVAAVALIAPTLVLLAMPEGISRFIINTIVCIISVALSVAYVGCSREERTMLIQKCRSFITHR